MKWLYRVFGALCMIMGFSTFSAAQYGAPVTTFKLTCNLKSLECNQPVAGIKVSSSGSDRYQKVTVTDSAGNFTLYFDEYELMDSISLTAEDIDGKRNGEYKKTLFNIPDPAKYFDDEINPWRRSNKDPKTYYMEYAGIPPCRKEDIPENTAIREEDKNKLNPIVTGEENKKPGMASASGQDVKEKGPDAQEGYEQTPGPYVPEVTEQIMEIRVYPNPAAGKFNLETKSYQNENATIRVYDPAGKLIMTHEIQLSTEKNTSVIDLSGKSKGVYIVDIETQHDLYTTKILKQ